MNPVYLSTGAFTGRVNNRDPHLATRFYKQLDCDGLEFLIFPSLYDDLTAIVGEYRAAGLRIPVVHADKTIGDSVSTPGSDAWALAEHLLRVCCEAASALGAEKLVVHCWGIPESDAHFELIVERVGRLAEIAASYGLDFLPENCFCVNGSPLDHFGVLTARWPSLDFIVDTRCAQFHAELTETVASDVFRTRVRHIHINDYGGGYKDWNAMYPILQPPLGRIDWDAFFAGVRAAGYRHSFTLEAPSMLPDRVDAETLNRGLRFIRERL